MPLHWAHDAANYAKRELSWVNDICGIDFADGSGANAQGYTTRSATDDTRCMVF